MTVSNDQAPAEMVKQALKLWSLGTAGRLRSLLGTPLGIAGIAAAVLPVVMAIGADILAPYSPTATDFGSILLTPSLAHPFGTDDLGRDVFSNVVYGSRVSLLVGAVSVGCAAFLGGVTGLVSGYLGGTTDEALMCIVDGVYAFPTLLLALAIAAVLGPSLSSVIIAIGIVTTPTFARLMRGEVLSVREREYVLAARILGAKNVRILILHVLPNVVTPLIVQASMSIGDAIVAEASLSFLGVGMPPPTPSWGAMLETGYGLIGIAPWVALFPGALLVTTVLGLSFVGDSMRLWLDPWFQERARR